MIEQATRGYLQRENQNLKKKLLMLYSFSDTGIKLRQLRKGLRVVWTVQEEIKGQEGSSNDKNSRDKRNIIQLLINKKIYKQIVAI